jgi:hypothetical protein
VFEIVQHHPGTSKRLQRRPPRMKKLFKKIARIIQNKGGTVLPGLVNKVNQQFREFYSEIVKKSYSILPADCCSLFLIFVTSLLIILLPKIVKRCLEFIVFLS